MQHPVERAIDRDVLGDVVQREREAGPVPDGRTILRGSGDEVVHAEDFHTLLQQKLAKVRANEPGPSSDENPHDGLGACRGNHGDGRPAKRAHR